MDGHPEGMGQGCFRLLFFATVAAAALIGAGSASASSCGTRLLTDWRDGRVDGTYSVRCYRDALAELPEDVKVYSTAQDDLTRALQMELREQRVARRAAQQDDSGGVSTWLVAAISLSVLVAAASVAAALR